MLVKEAVPPLLLGRHPVWVHPLFWRRLLLSLCCRPKAWGQVVWLDLVARPWQLWDPTRPGLQAKDPASVSALQLAQLLQLVLLPVQPVRTHREMALVASASLLPEARALVRQGPGPVWTHQEVALVALASLLPETQALVRPVSLPQVSALQALRWLWVGVGPGPVWTHREVALVALAWRVLQTSPWEDLGALDWLLQQPAAC